MDVMLFSFIMHCKFVLLYIYIHSEPENVLCIMYYYHCNCKPYAAYDETYSIFVYIVS
jgi:hypothetical protein